MLYQTVSQFLDQLTASFAFFGAEVSLINLDENKVNQEKTQETATQLIHRIKKVSVGKIRVLDLNVLCFGT